MRRWGWSGLGICLFIELLRNICSMVLLREPATGLVGGVRPRPRPECLSGRDAPTTLGDSRSADSGREVQHGPKSQPLFFGGPLS